MRGQQETCKICLEKDDIDTLISPCHCKGSIKYVHPDCMAGWRKTLLQVGNDIYHCQLCKQKLRVRQRTLWSTLLNYRVFRFITAAIILGFVLIPSGYIMKAFIHFSVLLLNYPGGITQVWYNHTIIHVLWTSIQSSIFASSTSHIDTTHNIQVIYSPFPVCVASSTHNHALFSNQLLYYFLLPFSDERLWQLILCKLEHFHLGFFFLGSVNNIVFTYKLLRDMFDIVILGPDDTREDQGSITRRLSVLLHYFLLTYCSSLVVLFWIHFNIFAFHANSQTTRQFVAEFPLWILRWFTLGIAVGDFATRGIYRWLTKMANCVDEQDILSLPENHIE